MALELMLEEYNDLAVVTLQGSVRASNADYLWDNITYLLEQGYSRIVLDCEDLASIHSHGLSVLARLVESTTGVGKIVICNASQSVIDLLELSGLDQFIEISPDRSHAFERVLH